MSSTSKNLIRPLNSREQRRYLTQGMLPVDAVDPSCLTSKLIDSETKILYRYGCGLEDMNITIEDNGTEEKRNPIFRMRGFHSCLAH
jgi:hypothetical protein